MKDDKKKFKRRTNNKKGNNDKREDLKVKEDNVPNSANMKNHSMYGNPNWYFTDKDLAEQASRFSFQSYIGNGDLSGDAKLPSIMSFYMHPSIGGYIGVTQDYDPAEDNAAIQAVNLCARKIYSRLSAMSGRTASYQPQDVMFAILGIGEVISIVSHLRRILGLAFTYNYRNRDFPSNMLKALGVKADDLFANLAKYRVELNTTLNTANKIPILANIMWFEKCSRMYEAIFRDSDDEMAQMYAFVPGSTWIVDETSSETGTILKTVPFCLDLQNNTPYEKTFGDYLLILKGMINALLTSTTFNVIYSDILQLNAKQSVPLMQLDLIREDYGVIPQYDPEVLLHIHNMNIYPLSHPDYFENTLASLSGRSTSNCNDVFQDVLTNNLIYAPIFQIYESKNLTDIGVSMDQAANVIKVVDIVDFPYGNPDLTERVEATRFSIRLNAEEIFPGETGEDVFAYAKTLPDHFCSQANYWIAGTTTSTVGRVASTVFNNAIGARNIAEINKFRYAPLLYRYLTSSSMQYIDGEINYFTKLDGVWLKRLNSLCYQGLFELR